MTIGVLTRARGYERRATCDLEVIVPALNEEVRLPSTLLALDRQLAQLPGVKSRIVVVDNGSCDGTLDAVDAFTSMSPRTDVALLGCSVRGKGAAVRRGILTSQASYIGFFDADQATPAKAVTEALSRLSAGSSIVIASRRCEGAAYAVRQTPARRLASWAFNRAIEDLLPGLRDTQCGFKFFTLRAARDVFDDLETTGFTFDVELLVRARACGYEIDEMPVTWTDDQASSLDALADAPRILVELLHLRRVCQQIA